MATLHYDAATVQDTPSRRWCWRCVRPMVNRRILAHLLDDDGIDTRVVTWTQCPGCGRQYDAKTEVP